jgi:hypothetical protein
LLYVDEHPAHLTLLRDISTYILALPGAQTTLVNGEPTGKKRKLENGHAAAGKSITGTWADAATRAVWRAPDTSFSIPQRKKLGLEMVKGAGGGKGGIRGMGATGEVEFGVAWGDVGMLNTLNSGDFGKVLGWGWVVIRG